MDFVLFMIISVLEGVAIFYIACSLFRFRATDYLLKFLFIDALICLGNYLLRNEEMGFNVAPVFSLLMLILFFKIFLQEVSLFWAAVMAICGYASYGVMQTALVLGTDLTGIVTLQNVQERDLSGYILIAMIALAGCVIARYLYKTGRGFTFDLEKFRFAKENVFVTFLIIACIVGFGILFYMKQLLIASIVFLLASAYLIVFSIRRQKDDIGKVFSEHSEDS